MKFGLSHMKWRLSGNPCLVFFVLMWLLMKDDFSSLLFHILGPVPVGWTGCELERAGAGLRGAGAARSLWSRLEWRQGDKGCRGERANVTSVGVTIKWTCSNWYLERRQTGSVVNCFKCLSCLLPLSLKHLCAISAIYGGSITKCIN